MDAADIFIVTKLTRKRNATNLFPRHFSHVVLNGLNFIYRYAGLHTFHALSIFLQTLLYFRSIYRRCKKCKCGLTTWRFDTKKCVYMCLIDLLNNYSQNGLTAIFKMLRLNFEKKNHSLGIFEYMYVLLQIVVARRYNESRSRIVR